jgi:hypothetical protein
MLLRWRDWGPGKVSAGCTVVVYISLVKYDLSYALTGKIILLMIIAGIHGTLGYLVNNWSDRTIDRLHGKSNVFSNMRSFSAMALLLVVFAVACLSIVPFLAYPWVLPLWITWFLAMSSYSLRPFRFKERGIWGILVSILAQWSLPVLLAFAVMEGVGGWEMLVLVGAYTVSGATLEIGHQRWDRLRDQTTNTGTLGATLKAEILDRIYGMALKLDKIAIGAIILIVSLGILPHTSIIQRLVLMSPIPIIYIAMLFVSAYEGIRESSKGCFIDPYFAKGRSANKFLHETIPNLILPGYLLLVLAVHQPFNITLLMFFLFWRLVLGDADWKWPIRSLKAKLGIAMKSRQ